MDVDTDILSTPKLTLEEVEEDDDHQRNVIVLFFNMRFIADPLSRSSEDTTFGLMMNNKRIVHSLLDIQNKTRDFSITPAQESTDLLWCGRLCTDNDLCLTFNIGLFDAIVTCELTSLSMLVNDYLAIPDDNYDIYGIK